MDALHILKEARKKISDPTMWGKGGRNRERPICTYCVTEAIEESDDRLDYKERKRAFRALKNAAGIDDAWGEIVQWNDAPERTHEDILKTLDLAIAIIRL